MGREGRLVAICGIDGSGKATQANLLASRAEACGLRAELISFPRYGQSFFADLIERYLRGEFAARAADVDPYLAALPYALDRWQAAPQLRRWLEAGALVICNRYVPANMAHQGSKAASAGQRRAFCRWVAELEYDVLELPRPDLHLLLDVPPALAMRLMDGREPQRGATDRKPDIHESDLEHLRATGAAYREIAGQGAEEPGGGAWAVIACTEGQQMLPPDQIAGRVWSEVRKLL
ncbi:MAG: dTMP kinase [Planctomycetota bacterium]|jgi:dTMP kinase